MQNRHANHATSRNSSNPLVEHELAAKIQGLMLTPEVTLAKAAAGLFKPVADSPVVRSVLAGAPAGALFYIDEDCNDYFEELNILYLVASGQEDPMCGVDFVLQAYVWGVVDAPELEDFCWQAEVVGTAVSDWDRIN